MQPRTHARKRTHARTSTHARATHESANTHTVYLDKLRSWLDSDCIEELREREAIPRHDDRPGLDAAVAVQPLLKGKHPYQLCSTDGHRSVDKPFDLDLPRVLVEELGALRDGGLQARMNGRDRCCAAQPEQQAPSAYTRRATSEMSLLIPNS